MLTLLSIVLISMAAALFFPRAIEGASTVLCNAKRRTYETQTLVAQPTKRKTKRKTNKQKV